VAIYSGSPVSRSPIENDDHISNEDILNTIVSMIVEFNYNRTYELHTDLLISGFF
jgi:hypothetical protein